MLLSAEIIQIIREGENSFVDFKANYHKCLVELLHDVLCLANADGVEDRYIIYGVKNSASEIIGLTIEPKKEDEIIDFLRNSNINSVPRVKVKTYRKIDGCNDIDVLFIENTHKKPYFLLADKVCPSQKHNEHKGETARSKNKDKILRAGVIYTRDGTLNTSINGTASEIQILSMWEERLGLKLSPLVRIENYLEDTFYWRKTAHAIANRSMGSAYYEKFPEFTIESYDEMPPTHKFYERWHTNECCRGAPHKLGVKRVALKYHNTILKIFELVNSEYKYLFPVPKYENSLDVNNCRAYISQSWLEFKMAAILDASDINENICARSYARGLKEFFCMNSEEFLIEVID